MGQLEFVLRRCPKTWGHCRWPLELSPHFSLRPPYFHFPRCSASSGRSTFSSFSALPQQLEFACGAHKRFKLLGPRQECWALPVDILGVTGKERVSRKCFMGSNQGICKDTPWTFQSSVLDNGMCRTIRLISPVVRGWQRFYPPFPAWTLPTLEFLQMATVFGFQPGPKKKKNKKQGDLFSRLLLLNGISDSTYWSCLGHPGTV